MYFRHVSLLLIIGGPLTYSFFAKNLPISPQLFVQIRNHHKILHFFIPHMTIYNEKKMLYDGRSSLSSILLNSVVLFRWGRRRALRGMHNFFQNATQCVQFAAISSSSISVRTSMFVIINLWSHRLFSA